MRSDLNIDHAALVALCVIVISWFSMTTLFADFGLWRQSIRFYDVWAVIQDPAGRLSGVNGAPTLATLGFGLVCAAAIVAPALSILYQRKYAWLTCLMPFVLMTVSCALLYAKSSSSYFPVDANSHSLGALVARIAHAAETRVGDTVASRISIGAGAYVAIGASLFLALRGLGKLRRAASRADAAAKGGEDLAPRR